MNTSSTQLPPPTTRVKFLRDANGVITDTISVKFERDRYGAVTDAIVKTTKPSPVKCERDRDGLMTSAVFTTAKPSTMGFPAQLQFEGVPPQFQTLKLRTLTDAEEFPAPVVDRLFDHVCRVATRQATRRSVRREDSEALAGRLYCLGLEDLRRARRPM